MTKELGSDKISVAFCCLGNICRSPMAEAVMRNAAGDMKLTHLISEIDSFGTSGFHAGDGPDRRTIQTCLSNGVPVNHVSRQVRLSDFDKFDYIFAMDRENLEDLKYMQPRGSKAKIMLFGAYSEDAKMDKIIKDPYYGGPDGFQSNFRQLDHFSRTFLKRLATGTA
ncbi:phosphotyrosine protein phosphatase I superfamily [Lipomyces kononenkoae]|uniref:Phosphotyrosine protein phosphatase I superfamily n=1 Tax=Lipomyces kononenkoae TaxID=34357 RepID=A0ACC3SWP3_LIPKO